MRSVILASYNGEKYLEAQLNSILIQIDKDDEVIVSDSNSTDRTLEIIKGLHDDRIKVVNFSVPFLKPTKFLTINKIRLSFVNGLKIAKGDIIYLADQDDIWDHLKVKTCEEEIRRNNLDLVVHSCSIIDSEDNEILDNTYGVFSKPKISLVQSLINSPFQGCCMVMTRNLCNKVLDNIELIDEINISHDHAISFVAMTKLGKEKIKIINKPLLKYRRHLDNASASAGKSTNSLSFKLKYRVNEILLYIRLKFDI